MALVRPQASSSCNCTSTLEFPYDVFLNFRGEDTRYGFTGNLYSALIQKGLKTLIDDEGLSKGDEISLALVKAIEGSRVSVVVFSQNYAASKWCLDELVKILDCMKLRRQLVVPVFYKIDPSMVRNQTGPYEKAMADHMNKLRDNKEKVDRWSSALYQAANLSGWHLESGYEFQFIQNIVEDISSRLKDPIFLESLTSQVTLQGLEFKDDVNNREYSELATTTASSKECNGKAEASNSRIVNVNCTVIGQNCASSDEACCAIKQSCVSSNEACCAIRQNCVSSNEACCVSSDEASCHPMKLSSCR